MIIPIDEKTQIVGTERAWELQKTRTRNGKQTWEPFKYFPSFRQAVADAVHREIRIHPAHGIAEAILAVAETVQKYEKLIPSEYKFVKKLNELGD